MFKFLHQQDLLLREITFLLTQRSFARKRGLQCGSELVPLLRAALVPPVRAPEGKPKQSFVCGTKNAHDSPTPRPLFSACYERRACDSNYRGRRHPFCAKLLTPNPCCDSTSIERAPLKRVRCLKSGTKVA